MSDLDVSQREEIEFRSRNLLVIEKFASLVEAGMYDEIILLDYDDTSVTFGPVGREEVDLLIKQGQSRGWRVEEIYEAIGLDDQLDVLMARGLISSEIPNVLRKNHSPHTLIVGFTARSGKEAEDISKFLSLKLECEYNIEHISSKYSSKTQLLIELLDRLSIPIRISIYEDRGDIVDSLKGANYEFVNVIHIDSGRRWESLLEMGIVV